MEQTNDILQKAIAKDQEALSFLYEQSIDKSYVYAKYLTKDEANAQDLLQECYVKAFDHLHDLDSVDHFQRWMKTIIVHQFYDEVRKKKREAVQPLEEEDISTSYMEDRIDYQPDEQVNQQAVAEIVKGIIDTLPEDQRIAIIMFYYDQYSIKEIAEFLECSENTVKSRLNYARKKIGLQVEEIEKKDGFKLYNIAVIPFFVWMLSSASKQEAVAPAIKQAVLQEVLSHNTASALHHAQAAKHITAQTSKTAAIGIKTKITLGVLALALAGGGFLYSQQSHKANTPAVVKKEEPKETSVFDENKKASAYFSEALENLDQLESFHVSQEVLDKDRNPLTLEFDYRVHEDAYDIAQTSGYPAIYQEGHDAVVMENETEGSPLDFMYIPRYSAMYAKDGPVLGDIRKESKKILDNGNLEVTITFYGISVVRNYFDFIQFGTDFVPEYEFNTVKMEINSDMLPVSFQEDNDYDIGIPYKHYNNARKVTFSQYNEAKEVVIPQAAMDAMHKYDNL